MMDTQYSIEQSYLESNGLKLIHRGKVRDSYAIPNYDSLRLVVTTDRASIFDFVLGTPIPGKGQILTAMTVFWLRHVLHDLCETHLDSFGAGIDKLLPESLRGNKDLQSRSMVVKDLKMLPVECVVRGYLTGSGWKSYQKTGMVCGHVLPPGLHDGSKLPEPIFTPTTKAQEGHDEDMDFNAVRKQYTEWPEFLSIKIYKRAAEYAYQHGMIIADTKFEYSIGAILADEVLTPDSSRFWLKRHWEVANEKMTSPKGFDKQFLREWGKTVITPFLDAHKAVIRGIDKLDPHDPRHREFVREIQVPRDVIDETTRLYLLGFKMLPGLDISSFQDIHMGLKA